MSTKGRILTGDRPTGKAHLGHFVGSFKNRVKLQDKYEVFLLIADYHSLTTHPKSEDISTARANSAELVLDYIAAGIDPERVAVYRQSDVPSVTELTLLFSMLVTVSRVERIPTLKDVIKNLEIEQPSLGLLTYPVLQSADILHVRANLVPVGKDQESHIELTKEIARRFNTYYQEVFPIPDALIGDVPTLVGTDGENKMSKSLKNAIFLSDEEDIVNEKVMNMFTDPKRTRADIPGRIEGNPVFVYHEHFNDNFEEVQDLKERYLKGKVGDVEVKKKLSKALNRFLEPMRERRRKAAANRDLVEDLLREGERRIKPISLETLDLARQAMGLS